MAVLVASTSVYRQGVYRSAVEGLGLETFVAGRAVDCAAYLRRERPQLLLVEAFLPWGGCDGVLEVAQVELGLDVPVIVVATGMRGDGWLYLSRYRVDDFLLRFPTQEELRRVLIETFTRQTKERREPASALLPQTVLHRTEKRRASEDSGDTWVDFPPIARVAQQVAPRSAAAVGRLQAPTIRPERGE